MNFYEAVLSPAPAAVVERLGWVLVHSLWQFAAVGAVAAVALRLLRHRSSAVRYRLLVLVLGVAAAAPVATWLLQPASRSPMKTPFGAVGGAATTVAFGGAEPRSAVLGPPADVAGPSVSPATTPAEPLRDRVRRGLEPWLPWAVGAWCVGVALCSLRPLIGWRVLRRLRTVGLSAPSDDVLAAFDRAYRRLGLRRAVRVSCSTLAKGPLVAGYFRPAVLLPVSLVTSIPVSQLEAILAHELAHVRRHDFVINLLQTLVETLFFYHPAVWWLSRRLRVEREHCCDDLVVSLFDNGAEYGRALIAVERLRGGTPALALGASDGSLLDRIRRIAGVAGDGDRRTVDRGQAALLGLTGLSVVAVLGLNWPAAAREADDSAPQSAIAELSGGVEVELIGVGFHFAAGGDAEEKGWWRPDGGPLPQPPQLPSGEFTIGDDAETRRRSREFLIHIRGLPDDHSVRTDYGVSAAAGSTFADGVWIGHHGAGPFDDLTTTRIRVGVATEPYGPLVTIDRDGRKAKDTPVPPEHEAFYDRVAPVGVKSSGGETTLLLDGRSFANLSDVAAWEIHAVDASGVRHRRSSELVPASGPRELTFAVPASDVDRFEYRLRPYRDWAVFDGVSLEPGRKSDVTVTTESSVPSDDRNEAAAEALGVLGSSKETEAMWTVLLKKDDWELKTDDWDAMSTVVLRLEKVEAAVPPTVESVKTLARLAARWTVEAGIRAGTESDSEVVRSRAQAARAVLGRLTVTGDGLRRLVETIATTENPADEKLIAGSVETPDGPKSGIEVIYGTDTPVHDVLLPLLAAADPAADDVSAALTEFLKSADPGVRAAAAQALGNAGQDERVAGNDGP